MIPKRERIEKHEIYRQELRHHFVDHIKNPQLKQKFHQNYMADNTSQHLKEQPHKSQPKHLESETTSNSKQKSFNQSLTTSGGDADRMLHYSTYSKYDGLESPSSRQHNTYDAYSLKQMPNNTKPPGTAGSSSRKYQVPPAVDDFIGDHSYMYENESNIGGLGNVSEDSAKSQRSSKTVVSRKSSQDLRKLVTSQCKLHELIDESIKEMCKTDLENIAENNAFDFQEEINTPLPLTLNQCKRCGERNQAAQSQKDVTTEIGKGDLSDCRNNTTLTISVDDVISSRVVNPMIHKLHRMYLNNLKEEMSLMEDLEGLPNKVNEVYKSIIFKPKE